MRSCFAIGLLLIVGCAAQPQPGTARVSIHIVAKPKAGVKEPIARIAVYDAAPKPARASGEWEHVDYSNLHDIIVWLEPIPASNAPTQAHASHASHALSLDPATPSSYIHPASVGQKLVLQNASGKPLSAYSVSEGNDFETHDVPPGGRAEISAKSEGLIEILGDSSHPPIALVYVAPSPWVRRVKSGETISFNDVPPGEYLVVAWHARLPGSDQRITLTPNRTADCTLQIGVNSLSTAR